jgi:hypothetical protein
MVKKAPPNHEILRTRMRLFRKVQVVAEPLPRLHLRDIETGAAVSKGCEEPEAPGDCGEDDTASDPAAHLARGSHALADGAGSCSAVTLDGRRLGVHGLDAEDELDQGAGDETRGEMGGQIVVQEELASHDVEGNVVGCPGEEEESSRVVKTGARA